MDFSVPSPNNVWESTALTPNEDVLHASTNGLLLLKWIDKLSDCSAVFASATVSDPTAI